MELLMHEMNPWWEEKPKLIGIKREKYLIFLEKNLSNKDIILVTGLRRVGKSTILKQFIYELIVYRRINPRHICYLSLDAYAFKEFSILGLIRKFREIQGLKINEKIYVFLDEVTTKKSAKQELKNLYDLGGIKLFASSSSATLLKDKRAFLTGRSRLLEVEPLDFKEFLIFKNLTFKKSEKYLLENYFKKYLELGGMPEYVLSEDPAHIINLVNNIIYKDIVGVYNIKDSEAVENLFRLLCERVGKQLSYNKLSKVLGISNDTVKKYVNYFVECFLFYVIEKDARSLNERIASNKKIYCADIGIKNITTGFKDLGAIYENLVFLKIKHNKPKYVKKDGIEIDFKYGDYLIEAKYGPELNKQQDSLFKKIKIKNKIIANGVEFFEEDL